jgi:nitrogen fixation protein FixH
MSDDVIRGMLVEKKRQARMRRQMAGTAVLLMVYAVFGLIITIAIASS